MFPVIAVPAEGGTSIEQLGTKEKFWYDDPQLGSCLCKVVRPYTGEDWSEKIAAELAALLGLPHARYELAEWMQARCVISPSFVPRLGALVPGNQLLVQIDPSYSARVTRYRQTRHTVQAVVDAIQSASCQLPFGWDAPEGVSSALDVFAGYLMLDALIGNTDRHHENWGSVQVSNPGFIIQHLAPTFDHASSLGCHESDEVRLARLATKDSNYGVCAYGRRARSALYAHPDDTRPMSPLKAFAQCAKMTAGAKCWLSRLDRLSAADIDYLLEQIPAAIMSGPARQFAKSLLLCNREELIGTC